MRGSYGEVGNDQIEMCIRDRLNCLKNRIRTIKKKEMNTEFLEEGSDNYSFLIEVNGFEPVSYTHLGRQIYFRHEYAGIVGNAGQGASV